MAIGLALAFLALAACSDSPSTPAEEASSGEPSDAFADGFESGDSSEWEEPETEDDETEDDETEDGETENDQ